MPKSYKEGKTNNRSNRAKKVKRNRLKRLVVFLSIIFVIIAAATAITAYAAVNYYLKDVPDFDLTKLEPAKTSFLYDKEETLVTPLMGAENRIVLSLDEMSPHLVDAFLAIEDDRFYDHPGFDTRGIFRALWKNITNSGTTQGASTITQQLVKNAFLTPDRTMKRKVQELYMSFQLEQIFSKDEILEFYLNRIFFDYNAYGVEAAAQTYFGKNANNVTLAEAAMLAGIPNLPGKYSPYRNFEEAKKRQKLVLNRMVETGMISSAEADAAAVEELTLAGVPKRSYPHPWFIDHVVMNEAPDVLKRLPDYEDLSEAEIQSRIYTSGLHIYTTLDQRIQKEIVNVIENGEEYNKNIKEKTQMAVVVAQPDTGHVAAIIGGRKYNSGVVDDFNRATEGRYQAGSVLKPIIAYAPAFNEGIASPGTVLDDAPTMFAGNPPYFPNNYTMRFLGLVTARYAMAHSLNIPAIRLLEELGVEKGKQYAQRMGISGFTNEDAGLAMVVGGLTKGVNPWETAQAFSVLANEGIRTDFTTITKIVDSKGTVIYEHEPSREEIISPEAAWLTTSALIDTVRYGTATALRIGRTVAAKTGTSDNAHDAWMAAYTPDYVTTFWIGEDSWPDPKVDGGYRSFQMTSSFMNPILKAVHEELPESEFKRPGTLRQVQICKKSGLRPSEFCPEGDIISDWFIPENTPSGTCNMHVEAEVCTETGLLASEFCPHELREVKSFLNRPEYLTTDDRWPGTAGRVPEDSALMPPVDVCDIHTARPDGVKNLEARQVNAAGDIQLYWDAASEEVAGYLIARKRDEDSDFVLLTEDPVIALSYIDAALESGTYTYRVTAVYASGIQSEPATANITIHSLLPPPEEEPEDPDESDKMRPSPPGHSRRKD